MLSTASTVAIVAGVIKKNTVAMLRLVQPIFNNVRRRSTSRAQIACPNTTQQ